MRKTSDIRDQAAAERTTGNTPCATGPARHNLRHRALTTEPARSDQHDYTHTIELALPKPKLASFQ